MLVAASIFTSYHLGCLQGRGISRGYMLEIYIIITLLSGELFYGVVMTFSMRARLVVIQASPRLSPSYFVTRSWYAGNH